jgi:hypothetical protein
MFYPLFMKIIFCSDNVIGRVLSKVFITICAYVLGNN